MMTEETGGVLDGLCAQIHLTVAQLDVSVFRNGFDRKESEFLDRDLLEASYSVIVTRVTRCADE
jgi:hypothetical protein